MVGKKEIVELITPEEALEIFQNSTLEEIYIAMDLYKVFTQAHGGTNDALWDVLLHDRKSTGDPGRTSKERYCKLKIILKEKIT